MLGRQTEAGEPAEAKESVGQGQASAHLVRARHQDQPAVARPHIRRVYLQVDHSAPQPTVLIEVIPSVHKIRGAEAVHLEALAARHRVQRVLWTHTRVSPQQTIKGGEECARRS